MRHLPTWAAVLTMALTFASTEPALACGLAERSGPSREEYAAAMVGEAAHVDLATAVRADPIDIKWWLTKAGTMPGESPDSDQMFGRSNREERAKKLLGLGAASIAFRSVEKLKGDGTAEFHLYGFWNPPRKPTVGSAAEPEIWPGRTFTDSIYVGELWPTAFSSSCERSVIGRTDGLYLIFRDADGRLLSTVRIDSEGASGAKWGWAFEEVHSADDPWLMAVRQAAAR